MHFFATCPKGLESLLAEEVRHFVADEVHERVAGVEFHADVEAAYQVCLWSRLANSVLLVLAEAAVLTADDVYSMVGQIDWMDHFGAQSSIAVNFSGLNSEIRNTHFGALKVKDAVVDYFRARSGDRPLVDTKTPDLRIHARLHRNRLTVSLDLSGPSLHRRGYRRHAGAAPLKENLAAAVLLRARWPELARQGASLVDPLCGSGTFLIEAGLMAADIAPGLLREDFGFLHWRQHKAEYWGQLHREAQARKIDGLEKLRSEFYGYDADKQLVSIAQANAQRAGLNTGFHFHAQELSDLRLPKGSVTGLLVCNPPYGERLGDEATLIHLYEHLGARLKEYYAGWQVGVFTSNDDLAGAIGLRSHKQYRFYNGAIPARLMLYQVRERAVNEKAQNSQSHAKADGDTAINAAIEKPDENSPALSDGAQMFANRLKKNAAKLSKWVNKNNVSCYRLYDADMPEYAVAIDRYNDYLHVTEYAPPAKVDKLAAHRRLEDIKKAIPVALDVAADHIVYKQRRKQKGKAQYEKLAQDRQLLKVNEGRCQLLVNLYDYLDTGLFLDHRPIRLKIAEIANNRRFLNLFCYTAAASVHAALGGAKSTTSVDMSNTYIGWAKKNFAQNGLSESRHHFVVADCLQWISECKDQFDLIFLDPPSFSNSKKMQDTLDVQRDHEKLIVNVMKLLSDNGQLIFSNNLKSFRLAENLPELFDVQDISDETIDVDFQRNKKIHKTYIISHKK